MSKLEFLGRQINLPLTEPLMLTEQHAGRQYEDFLVPASRGVLAGTDLG